MHVDTMRKIDYYAGVPLTFLGTLFLKLKEKLFPPSDTKPENLLFIELSEMGSTILVDPAMRKARDVLGMNLHFAIFKKNKPSLDLLKTVPEENIYTIREDGLVSLLVDTVGFLFWCRKKKIDAVIDLELFSRFTALLTGFSGAKVRVGYHAFHNEGLYRGEMLTRRVAYNAHMHIAKNFIALVNALGAEKEELPFSKTRIGDDEIRLARAEVSEASKAAIRESVKSEYPGYEAGRHRLVLVNPNASELLPQRRWMQENYAQVIRMILDHDEDALVLITGAPGEREEAQQLIGRAGDRRVVNFAGKSKLTELPALYVQSTLMLTNDSGPGHFSAVTDMPTFVIFGPETPALYGSLGNSTPIYAGLACSPCVSAANHRKTPCTDNVCIQVITPEQVFQTIRPVLDAGK